MNMKKLNYFFALLCFVCITSCGDSNDINLTTEEGLSDIKELAIAQFGGDLEVFSFSLYAVDDLNDNLGSMSISYFKEDGEIYRNTYNVITYNDEPNLVGEKKEEQITKFRPKWKTPEGNGKIKIKDIDFASILPNILKAAELLGDEAGSIYAKNYDFKAEPETNAIVSSFELQFTPSENATTLEGRNIVTNYYEQDFEVSADGEVTIKE